MKITLLLTGKTTESYIKEGFIIFEKRIKHAVPFETIIIPDIPSSKKQNPAQVKEKEADIQLKYIKETDFVVLLDENGREFRSIEFADFLQKPENYTELGNFYQQKRDLFLQLISTSRFKSVPAAGTYFQLLDYSRISDEKEIDFAIRLTKEFGIASVPVSPFCHDNADNKVLRFCFAKTTETLEKAAEVICRI